MLSQQMLRVKQTYSISLQSVKSFSTVLRAEQISKFYIPNTIYKGESNLKVISTLNPFLIFMLNTKRIIKLIKPQAHSSYVKYWQNFQGFSIVRVNILKISF